MRRRSVTSDCVLGLAAHLAIVRWKCEVLVSAGFLVSAELVPGQLRGQCCTLKEKHVTNRFGTPLQQL